MFHRSVCCTFAVTCCRRLDAMDIYGHLCSRSRCCIDLYVALSPLHAVAAWTPMDTCGHLCTRSRFCINLYVALSPLHAVAAWTPMDIYGHFCTRSRCCIDLYVALPPLHAVAAWTPMDAYALGLGVAQIFMLHFRRYTLSPLGRLWSPCALNN